MRPWPPFGGLAQIIVQSTRESGAIELTAQSPGLRPTTIAIATRAAASPRPTLP